MTLARAAQQNPKLSSTLRAGAGSRAAPVPYALSPVADVARIGHTKLAAPKLAALHGPRTKEWLSGQMWVSAERRCVVAAQQQKATSAAPPGTRPAGGRGQHE